MRACSIISWPDLEMFLIMPLACKFLLVWSIKVPECIPWTWKIQELLLSPLWLIGFGELSSASLLTFTFLRNFQYLDLICLDASLGYIVRSQFVDIYCDELLLRILRSRQHGCSSYSQSEGVRCGTLPVSHTGS